MANIQENLWAANSGGDDSLVFTKRILTYQRIGPDSRHQSHI
jgi:hypothetical protein